MIDEILEELESDNTRTLEALHKELAKVRTGRAHVGILDHVRIDYYGDSTPLNQVAALSVPDPRQISIKPYDRSIIGTIEKAIMTADLGLTPMSDGEFIRLNIPPLTTERRRDMTKLVRRYGEDCKVAVRQHRRDANDTLKTLEKEGEASEDDVRRAMSKVQDATDAATAKIDEIVERKEHEVMED